MYDGSKNRPISVLSKSYRGIQEARSHNTGTPHNPASLIGLQLTPVSSICFRLKRALKSCSLPEGDKKNKSLHV